MQSEIWRSLEAVIGLDAASAWGTLTEQNGGGALPAGNGDGQGLQLSRVILLSNEPSVRATLETAIGEQQRLIVASGFDELRAALEAPAEAVVVDVAASERLDAWERVRTQHAGMVLVAVDSQDETREWPPDPARRFLVRPLHAEEIVAALAAHPRILREPAAARRRRLAQARRPPVVPPLAVAPDHAPAAIEPVRRLSSGESLWEEPGDQADPTAADAPPEPRLPGLGRLDRQRSRLTAAVMLLLLLATAVGGIAIGRATASPDRGGPGTATPAASTPLSTPSTAAPDVVIQEKTPAACDAALAAADAAVSYLVGNIRDQRLTQSMQSYQQNRRACREASR